MTTAINIFLRQAIRENGIPFELKLSVPNQETVAAITEAENWTKIAVSKVIPTWMICEPRWKNEIRN